MRATKTQIEKLVPMDEDHDLTPFMEMSHDLVEEHCVPPGTLSESRLTMIENWLGAHFYALLNSRESDVSVDVIRTRFATQDKVDLGLDLTVYGQTAKRLDSTLALAGLDNAVETVNAEKPAGGTLSWLGTDDDEEGP